MTFEEVLREFAAYPRGLEFEVGVFRVKELPRYRPEGFDIDDPAAMAAEVLRLQQIEQARAIVHSARGWSSRQAAQRKVMRHRAREALRHPCKVCGRECPENALGVVAMYCGATCRSIALLRRRAAEKRCRRVCCSNGAAEGKTYCRAHLDAFAAKEREKRRQRREAA